jgi:Uma2 family endonuclease
MVATATAIATPSAKKVMAKKSAAKAQVAEIPFRKSPLDQIMQEYGSLMLPEKMTKDEFKAFAAECQEVLLEHESDGTVIIMPLVHGGSGKRETKVIVFVGMWQLQTGLGEVYGSTTGFNLPDGSTRAPDAAWISDDRLADLSDEEEESGFIPVVPDFVVEVRSSSDRLPKVREKMTNIWMKNGVRLGWVIDPYNEKAFIYRQNGETEEVNGFKGKKLYGEDVMPGLEIPLEKLRVKKKK